MDTLLGAMARQEGFYVRESRAAKNHNPGNMEFGTFAREHGAIATDGRFSIFPDDATGFKAMASLISSHHYAGMTIHDAIYTWLGYSIEQAKEETDKPNEPGNKPQSYVRNVCAWSGLQPSDIASQHLEIPT